MLSFRDIYQYQVIEMDRIREAVGLKIENMQIHIDNPDLQNIFILRFNRDMKKAIEYLEVVDDEIERRNNLIGVFA